MKPGGLIGSDNTQPACRNRLIGTKKADPQILPNKEKCVNENQLINLTIELSSEYYHRSQDYQTTHCYKYTDEHTMGHAMPPEHPQMRTEFDIHQNQSVQKY